MRRTTERERHDHGDQDARPEHVRRVVIAGQSQHDSRHQGE